MPGVEQYDAELLHRPTAEGGINNAAARCGVWSCNARGGWTSVRRPTHGGHNLRRAAGPIPDARQVVASRLHEAVLPPRAANSSLGHDECIALMTAAAEDQGDQFVVAEGPGAIPAVSRVLVVRRSFTLRGGRQKTAQHRSGR